MLRSLSETRVNPLRVLAQTCQTCAGGPLFSGQQYLHLKGEDLPRRTRMHVRWIGTRGHPAQSDWLTAEEKQPHRHGLRSTSRRRTRLRSNGLYGTPN
jgi:hypothetical protein